MNKFDYGKLRERIRDLNTTQASLAHGLGISHKTLSAKMNGHQVWRQDEIYLAMQLLNIPDDKLSEYFFTPKVLE